ncbi:thioredoxin-like protein [Pterulicium gracile]|uniref:Large ribosomal subunit protein mL43 n=1 Tax=Pterulicium gracile TaxID=1884261 RepID=A0A5C3QW93_9AGAR|nr:thioredoxin-like protein [Pterula gracilis]
MAGILRAQLRSSPANGHSVFLPQLRKLVFEYSESWPSSANTRTFILNHVEQLAKANPHVEVVVRPRHHREPVVRGLYINNREKVIGLKEFEVTSIEKKVQLLLDSSGAKIKPLKRRTVESTTEAVRGIWSGMHAERPSL